MHSSPPRSVRIACQLLILSLFVICLTAILQYTALKLAYVRPLTFYKYNIGFSLLNLTTYIIITACCVYFMHKGKNWARIVMILYILIHTFLNYITHTLEGATIVDNIFVFTWFFLQVIIIVILFMPNSNVWFSCKKPTNTE